MTVDLFLACVGAGIVYVVTPGPATLAVVGLAAARGRRAALGFFAGHGVGDAAWSALALAALLGASRLGPELFAALGLACAAYLVVLGIRAIRSSGEAAPAVAGGGSPFRTGIAFGLTNPKAYPFALAMYGALAIGGGTTLGLGEAARIFVSTLLGMAIGDVITVAWAGSRPVARLFGRFRGVILKLMGGLFVAFGLRTGWDAISALSRR